MPKCSFCKKEYDIHKGVTLVLNSGEVRHLCSAKCRKNMNMKRRKVRWVSDFKSEAKKKNKGRVKSKAKGKGKKKK